MTSILANLSAGSLAFFGGIGPWEVVVVLLVLLLLFGGKKLPELARGMGRGLRHFKEELHGVRRQISDATEVDVDVPDDEPEPERPGASDEPKPADEPRTAGKSEKTQTKEA